MKDSLIQPVQEAGLSHMVWLVLPGGSSKCAASVSGTEPSVGGTALEPILGFGRFGPWLQVAWPHAHALIPFLSWSWGR